MGPHKPDGRDAPQVVTVEVTVPDSTRSSRRGGIARGRVVLALGALGALAVIVAVLVGGGSARHSDPITARRGPAGVAAAYGYPLGCMRVTIPAADRTYARAELTHAAGCGGITGYAPAIFHYAAGRWRLVPDAIGYMCNRESVPAAVDQALELCVGAIGSGCAAIENPGQGRPAARLGLSCAELPKISGVV
jgi:hypothetical protein